MNKQKEEELIFIDKDQLKKVERQLNVATGKLNDFYTKAISLLGKLEIYKPEDLYENGDTVIQEELRARYKFPEADDAFNLQAIGIDPTALLNEYHINCHYWQSYDFKFNGSIFVPAEEISQLSRCYYYEDTEERKRVMKLVRKVIDLYQELHQSNLIESPITFVKSFPFGMFANDGTNIKLSEFAMSSFIYRIDNGEFSLK